MVTLRLQRFGRKNRPFYRIVAIEKLKRRQGPVLENLGTYDPINPKKEAQVVLKTDRVKHWLSKGAQPSDTVRDMLGHRGLINVKEWEKDREMDRKRLAERQAKAAVEAEKKPEEKKK